MPSFVVDAVAGHLAAFPAVGDNLLFTGAEGQPIARAWLHRA